MSNLAPIAGLLVWFGARILPGQLTGSKLVGSDSPNIGIDTSVIREAYENGPSAPAVRELLALAAASKLKLVASATIGNGLPEAAISGLPLSLIRSNPEELGVDLHRTSPAILAETVLGDGRFEDRFAKAQILAAVRVSETAARSHRDWGDWEHLHFHLVNGRTYYVTVNLLILAVALDLSGWFPTRVMTPEEAVERFRKPNPNGC